MTRTVSTLPAAIIASATCMPYSQPLHAAPTSKATARDAPSAACNSTAAEGSSRSGEQVPTMIMSSSAALTPAAAIALCAASVQMDVSVSPGPAMCRSRMPVRSRIHASSVSMPIAANSSFRNTRFGTA